ncbi:MAG: hypothetical protein WCC06_03585 [Candidatus Aminicenantales bacterium]
MKKSSTYILSTLIAVVRSDQSFASPRADFSIEEGNTLVLVANHRDINRSFQFLSIGPGD